MNRRDLLVSAGVLGSAMLSPARLAAAMPERPEATGRYGWPDIGTDWTDGLPLANGTLGAMVWGRGNDLVISLDRLDVWDLRPVAEFEEPGFTYANLVALRAAGNRTEIARLFEDPFHHPGRGKLPLGRLHLGVAARDVARSSLDVDRGLGEVVLKDGTTITVFVAAEATIGVVRVDGPGAAAIAAGARIEAPPFGRPPAAAPPPGSALNYGGAEDLGYPTPLDLAGDGRTGYASGRDGEAFAVVARTRAAGTATILTWTIAPGSTREAAAQAAGRTLDGGATVEALLRAHVEWWRRFWTTAGVATGDAAIERRWRLSTYHLGAAARSGGAPVPLQSPWTWDNGRLPAWKGDYHHDLNTQMTYWPAHAGNRPEVSRNLVDWLWATRGEGERFARDFFGAPGIGVPGTADIRNRPLGGWAAYSYFPTASAWLLHHFDLHWRYFGDRTFLKERAYPYAAGVTTFLTAMLRPRPGREGLFLPLGISPEINDNKLESWFDEWTNFDLALVRYAFTAAARMATALGRRDDAARHAAMLGRLPLFARDEDGGFAVAPGVPLAASHRHFSHLLAFYPLKLLDPATDPDARRALDVSLARLERLGTKMWMGYSFAWLTSLYALAGRGIDAARTLAIYEDGFSGRNGFHTNGDRSGRGITAFPGRLFTLDGGSAACAAVQEMLLQADGETVRLFPAVPNDFSGSFNRLAAPGGVVVTASMTGGRVVRASLTARETAPVVVAGPGLNRQRITLHPGRPFAVAV